MYNIKAAIVALTVRNYTYTTNIPAPYNHSNNTSVKLRHQLPVFRKRERREYLNCLGDLPRCELDLDRVVHSD